MNCQNALSMRLNQEPHFSTCELKSKKKIQHQKLETFTRGQARVNCFGIVESIWFNWLVSVRFFFDHFVSIDFASDQIAKKEFPPILTVDLVYKKTFFKNWIQIC